MDTKHNQKSHTAKTTLLNLSSKFLLLFVAKRVDIKIVANKYYTGKSPHSALI